MSEEIYKIVFLGAPRAGKSTLMAAWYHLTKAVYQAQPVNQFAETHDFVGIYESWLSGEQVQKTEFGDKIDARFVCKKSKRKFLLELSDYSGEDMLELVNSDLELEEKSAIESSLQSAIEDADWLIHVCDPERLAKGSAQDQNNALYFAKLLPKVLGERSTLAQTTSSYFSRADELSPEITDKAQKLMEESPDLEYLGDPCLASSVIPRGDDETNQEISVELQSFFNQTMTDLLAGVVAKPKKLKQINEFKWIFVFLGTLMIGFIWWSQGSSEIDLWSAEQTQFEEIKKDAVGATYKEGKDIAERLEKWETKNAKEFSEQLSSLDQEIEALKKSLSSIAKPKGADDITQVVIQALEQSGGVRSDFYKSVGELAKKHRTGDDWEVKAQTTWGEIEKFCTEINAGIEMKNVSGWVQGPQWWTSAWGFSDLQAEIWAVKIGDPCPFGLKTDGEKNDARIKWAGPKKPIKVDESKDHSVNWSTSFWEGESYAIGLDDQLWLRILETEGANETWIKHLIVRTGPLGLDWFNKVQSGMDINRKYSYEFRVSSEFPSIPEPITQAFKRQSR